MRSDPIGLEGGLNTYGYVGGSPLHGVDPMGLVSIIVEIGADIIPGIGGRGSVGGWFTTGGESNNDNQCSCDSSGMDAGVIGNVGVGAGFDMDVPLSLTLLRGGRENIDGTMVTFGFDIPFTDYAGEFHINPETKKIAGVSIADTRVKLLRALPGMSVTYNKAYTYSIRDFINRNKCS